MMVIRTGVEREGWGCIGRDIPLFPCYPARGGPQTRACREPWRAPTRVIPFSCLTIHELTNNRKVAHWSGVVICAVRLAIRAGNAA
jgi:hypothetical protein